MYLCLYERERKRDQERECVCLCVGVIRKEFVLYISMSIVGLELVCVCLSQALCECMPVMTAKRMHLHLISV